MKTKVYLYIAILISFLFNIGFFFHLKDNNKYIPYTNISDEYLEEQLDLSYSSLKLNGLSLENMKGVLWKDNKNENVELHTQLKSFSIVLYFSELSCSTCIKEHLSALKKIKRITKNVNTLLITNHLRNDVRNELIQSKLDFPIFELDEGSLTCLTDINKRFPTATIALFIKKSFIISSYVSNSETNHFNPQFYDSIYRYISSISKSTPERLRYTK